VKRAVEEAVAGNIEGPNRFFETEYKMNLMVREVTRITAFRASAKCCFTQQRLH